MKTVIFILGILLFVTGIFLIFSLRKINQEAIALDHQKNSYAMVSEDAPPPCSWDITLPSRVMSQNTSQTLIINATNTFEKECHSDLTLLAPGFDTSPKKEEQALTASANGKGSIAWVLTPRQTGTFEIALSDGLSTKTLGVKTTNMFGLSASHVQIASFLGTIFGPMFTVPWWFDKWFQRRKQGKKDQDQPSTNTIKQE